MLAVSATYPESLANALTRYMREPTFVRLNPTDPSLIGEPFLLIILSIDLEEYPKTKACILKIFRFFMCFICLRKTCLVYSYLSTVFMFKSLCFNCSDMLIAAQCFACFLWKLSSDGLLGFMLRVEAVL